VSKNTKKDRTQKVTENALPTHTRRPTSTKFCVWGRIPDVFLGFEFH